jgi:methylmalonyl-CoA mutase cobalamin-binding domain/chain
MKRKDLQHITIEKQDASVRLQDISGFLTAEGIEIKSNYSKTDIEKLEHIGFGAGFAPNLRGPYATMFVRRPWTIRQYAGFSTAEESNAFYRRNLAAGQKGLSIAFDLPTHRGYDSDHERVVGDVGKAGVAIDTVEDMKVLFDQIPLQDMSVSMTMNGAVLPIMAFYIVAAEEQGVSPEELSGTIQNDILKEFMVRNTYIYPPTPSMKIIADIFEYTSKKMPKFNSISISGYHIREAGSTAVQEIAFTLANAIAYVQAAVDSGLDVDDFAPRLSFFWNGHNNFFEEVAKFRASRRMWYKIMSERFGAKKESSKLLRFHTQTGGSTLTAQQPLNNIVRVAVQSLAAVLGGTQSLHTNGYDEALSLPTEEAARIALRTQQIIGYESGVADTPDPLAGSYFIENLTDEVERLAWEYIARIDEMGGAVDGIEAGFQQDEIEQAAYDYARSIDNDERVIVGVNKFNIGQEPEPKVFPIDPQLQVNQIASLKKFKADRDQALVAAKLEELKTAARGTDNLLYPMKEALRAHATLGEVSDALREIFGTYQPGR